MNKFLALVSGRLKEIVALVTSSGAGDAGKIVATDGSGKLDSSLMPVGVGAATKTIEASETLASSDVVNVWDDSGTVKVRKADATAVGKEANGFVLAGVTSGQNATVYFDDELTGLSGLTPGTRYYLSAATPGAITATAPSTAGNVVQHIGTAVSTSSIIFAPDTPIELA